MFYILWFIALVPGFAETPKCDTKGSARLGVGFLDLISSGS